MCKITKVSYQKGQLELVCIQLQGGKYEKNNSIGNHILLCHISSLFAQRTENVFILVIDGARYSETFGDQTHKYIPKM